MSGETAEHQQPEQTAPFEADRPDQARDEAAEVSPSPTDPDGSGVPEKQVHRWKDDGGAVIFD